MLCLPEVYNEKGLFGPVTHISTDENCDSESGKANKNLRIAG